MNYTIHEIYSGAYEIRDEDGDRVMRVGTFMPGPMVSLTGSQLMSPELARTVARVMRRVANAIERDAIAV